MKNAPPHVSVVIPAHNEATYIGRLLDALTRQTSVEFEVVVSDAHSEDGTSDVVKSYEGRFRSLRLVHSPPTGAGASRNAGAKVARGTWLLFLDADGDIDDPSFIRIMVDEAEKRGWATATAKVNLRDASLRERFGVWTNYQYIKLLAHTRHPVAPGACILTSRSLFEANDGFNEKIVFGEDYDYVSRVGRYGFGFIEKTYYYWDLRRPRREGIRLTIKALGNELYRHTHGYNLERTRVGYHVQKHEPRE